MTLGALLVVYPLVEGRDLGWPAWTFVAMAACLPVFALLGLHVRRVARRGGDPLVTPSLFGKRAFTGGLAAGTAFFASMIGFTLVFSLYLQIGLGYSAMRTGLANIPQAAGMVVGFITASAGLTVRLGRRLLHLGLAAMTAGTAAFAVQVHLAGTTGVPLWHLIPALAVIGLGGGLAMAPFFDIILAGVEPHETGSAAGTLSALQQLGGTLGIAIMGTLFFHILKIGSNGPDRTTVATGMQWVLWLVAALLVATYASAFLLPRRAREESLGH